MPSIRHFGIQPDDFQLDTVDGVRPSSEATALVPPRALTISDADIITHHYDNRNALARCVTKSVIDDRLRFSQSPGMISADEIREELIRQLDSETVKAADVARHLNIAPARVTEMSKRTRRVQGHEVRPLAQLLGMEETPALQTPVSDDDDIELQEWDIEYGMGGGTYLDLPVTGVPHKFSRAWLRHFTTAPPERVFIARGSGDSMMPTILDTDMVIIDTSQNDIHIGDKIWAVVYGTTGYIKRIRPMPDGGVKMLSDNPSVPPETAFDGELSVVGRVVAVVRKI